MPLKIEHTVAGWNGQSRPATLQGTPQAAASTASPVASMNARARHVRGRSSAHPGGGGRGARGGPRRGGPGGPSAGGNAGGGAARGPPPRHEDVILILDRNGAGERMGGHGARDY